MTTARINWIVTKHGGYTGHAGTLEPWLFQLWHCEHCSGEWSLHSTLAGQSSGDHYSSDDIGELKQRAETMLSDFADSLGAIFPSLNPDGAVTSRCECGGLARHYGQCGWREGYGSVVITEEGK